MPVAGGILGILLIAFWMYVILDVILTDSVACRHIPKPMWLFLVVLLPAIGSVAWLLLGRPEKSAFGPGDQALPSASRRHPRPAPMGIEDRPDWVEQADKMLGRESSKPSKEEIRAAADERTRKLREWESSLIKREKQLDDERRKRDEGES